MTLLAAQLSLGNSRNSFFAARRPPGTLANPITESKSNTPIETFSLYLRVGVRTEL
jgi:hypothetical protein